MQATVNIVPGFFGFAVELGRRRVFVDLVPWRFRVSAPHHDPCEVGIADEDGLLWAVRSRLRGRGDAPEFDGRTIVEERHRMLREVPWEVRRVGETIQWTAGKGAGIH